MNRKPKRHEVAVVVALVVLFLILVVVLQVAQVRSYHRAFSGELLIYSFGTSLRPYRPIPIRTVCWTAGFIAVAWILIHLLRAKFPMLTLGWAMVYVGIPLFLGWIFAAGEVEGRRLHVVVPIWIRHVTAPKRLVGGWRPPPSGPDRMRMRKRVRVWG